MNVMSTPIIHVLYIEDDEDDFILTRALLGDITTTRYQLDWADSYETAGDKIQNNHYDVALIDYNLGAESGIQLLEQYSSELYEFPKILITTIADPDIDELALSHGAADYLVKGDITARMLERSIRYAIAHQKTLNSLRHSEKSRQLFYATLAHDMKTPIRAEYRVLEMLYADHFGELSPTQKQIIHELIQSNRFLHHIVDNLMTVYKHTAAQVQLNKTAGYLNQMMVSLITQELSPLIQDKQHFVCLDLNWDIQPFLFDPFEIERVLRNLIQNAVFYTQRRGQITLKTEIKDTQVKIVIQDNGPGIPNDKLESLFQPFQTEARRFKHIGSGLGLYLSKQILDQHEGILTVRSRVEPGIGQGTVFEILLPYEQNAEKSLAGDHHVQAAL